MVLDFTWERREQLIRKEEFADGMEAGRAEEQKQTEKEKSRADNAEKEVEKLRKENERLKKLLGGSNPLI